jgi:ketosteroid isomerase-like protein
MPPENDTSADEAQIRALIVDRLKAVRTRDLNAATAHVAMGIVSFDVVNPLQTLGSEACRRRTEDWFASFQGEIGCDIRDLNITVGHDVAFSRSLYRVTGNKVGGEKVHMYWRATACYQKLDGKWVIVHEHNSVPFDPRNGKASVDLKP